MKTGRAIGLAVGTVSLVMATFLWMACKTRELRTRSTYQTTPSSRAKDQKKKTAGQTKHNA